jgi:hypothetical protein
MSTVNFPGWLSALNSDSKLNDQERTSYKITIRWFLGFCKRGGARADFEQAFAFIDFATEEKQANEWVIERWKEAIRWFFRAAKRAGAVDDVEGGARACRVSGGAAAARHGSIDHVDTVGALGDGSQRREPSSQACAETFAQARKATSNGARGPERQPARLKTSEPKWRLDCVRGIRIRNFSYTTEKSYLHWLLRFARYWETKDLEALGENEIKLFLDHLAVKERVSGGTQRVALNALVFYYRDVLKRELGDFSDYKKATGAKRIPVVLTVEEIRRILATRGVGEKISNCRRALGVVLVLACGGSGGGSA